MGYYDKFLMHEDKRDKGMNSTTSAKGTDGKKNNSSEYNHAYYMKNKAKWGVRTDWSEDDHDFDDKNYDEKNRLGDSDFFGTQNADGSWTVLLEDTKFKLPKGISKEELARYMEKIDRDAGALHKNGNPSAKDIEDLVQKGIDDIVKKHGGSGEEEFDVDAAARDVIRGKYKNGAERKAALGDDYELVQKKVNELMKKNVKHSDDDYLEHFGVQGMKWGVRRYETSSGHLTPAGQARYNTVEGKYQKVKAAKAKANESYKQYNKDFNKAFAASSRLNISKKRRAERDALIEKSRQSARKADKDIEDVKKAKIDLKYSKKVAKNDTERDRILEKRAQNREKLKAKEDAVKNYQKKMGEYSKAQDRNDDARRDLQEMRKSLGKTGLTRTINAARNKSAEAKAYNKAYDKWSSEQDRLDSQWNDVQSAYKNTGKTKLGRVVNNARFAKGNKVKDFDAGTRAVKAGYDRYSKTLKDYGSMKMKAVGNSDIKKTDAYKSVVKAYRNQVISDLYYGQSGTTLNYISEAARSAKKR